MRAHRRAGAAARGFTLVEALVALVAMAILGTLAWQGLDGVLRAREAGREVIERSTRLATIVTQWEQDLQSVHETGLVPALAFDGQSLRLTRRVPEGVSLVVWAVRSGIWQRWASPPHTTGAGLQQAWLASQQFLGNEPGQLRLLEGASEWQVYFHRGGDWSNAQSTGNLVLSPNAARAAPPAPAASPAAGRESGTPAAPSGSPPVPQATAGGAIFNAGVTEELPAAVRVVITLSGQRLTRDVALGPSGS